MGLDLYAACKIDNGIKTEPTIAVFQAFPHIPPLYDNPAFFRLRHFDPRSLVDALSGDEKWASLAARFYGNLPGRRHYFPDQSIAQMPQDLPDSCLPRVMSPSEALSIADEIMRFHHEDVPAAGSYLRFWGVREHPILCSF